MKLPNFQQIRQKLTASKDAGRRKQPVPLPPWLTSLMEKAGVGVREKKITAVSRTSDGIEWTSWKIKSDGVERLQQESAELEISGGSLEETVSSIELPEHVTESLAGDISVPLRTSELLMRVMDLPATDPDEIADIVGFQIDKISPFPQDQLAISYEVLEQGEETSRVLMVAAKRSCIDEVGDTFEAKGVRIHGIDARVLGWLKLLEDEGHIDAAECEIFIIDDVIDLSLVVLEKGRPVVFRMLDRDTSGGEQVEGLAEEIAYTLTTLETEHELGVPAAIQYWSFGELEDRILSALQEKSGIPVHAHTLALLPPLSEGIARRRIDTEHRIELVPREWIEHEERLRLRRQFTISASVIVGIWLAVLLIFYSIYKVRDFRLGRVEKELAAVKDSGLTAQENKEQLNALQAYTDRSTSALECLREVTRLLPPGDIEFASFNYRKTKGVTLRGSAADDAIVYDFFESLTDSELFPALKDQSVNTKMIKGVRSAVFSVSLDLPGTEEAP